MSGLNDRGEIVGGRSFFANASSQATTLNPLPGFTSAVALAINFNDLIVGGSFNSGQPFQATLWPSPTAVPVALAGPTEVFVSFFINTSGQIIGCFNGSTLATDGGILFWSSVTAQPVALPALSGGAVVVPPNGSGFVTAAAINAAGKVVGTSIDSLGNSKAVVWTNGQVQDLNTLIPSGSGWVLQTATGINDSGAIVGTGTLNGVQAAFFIAPI